MASQRFVALASMASNTADLVGENVDTLADLEERINRAVQIITDLRSDNEQLQAKLKKSQEDLLKVQNERDEAHSFSEEFQKENTRLEGRVGELNTELETLREERKQVKSRIEKPHQ